MNQILKLISEIIPIIIFFLLYKNVGLIQATTGLVVATSISLIITYYYERKISYVTLCSCLILAIFGGITIYTGDSKFIKLKPTVINFMFSAILFGGIMFKKGLVKYICGSLFELPEKAWIKLSYRWAIFFMTIAVLNEIIWRNFSDGVWIKFKVFGIIPLTIIFTMTQIPFLHKNKLEEINK